MNRLWHDLRFSLRTFARRPLLTGVVLLTLTLGIGANVTIFSLVSSVLLRPLSYPQPNELVTVWQDETARGGPEREWTSWDNFADWRAQSVGTAFDEMAALGGFRPTLIGEGEPEVLDGASASHSLLEVLGVEPLLGRNFTAEEDVANAAPVVLLGHAFWQRRFGGDQSVLGSSLNLQGVPHEVIGILPPGLEVPILGASDALRPLAIDASNSCGRRCITLRVVARLRDGVSLERAAEEMTLVAKRLEDQYPRANQDVEVALVPLHDLVVGAVRMPLLVLLAAVGLVLLVCCGNVANLLLARAHERRGELALRTALGAGRAQLVRQLLCESLVLSLSGGILGSASAWLAVRQLAHRLADQLPRIEHAGIDLPILLFALGLSLAAGLLFGVLPALRAAGTSLGESMQAASARSTGRLRSGLVIAEVSLALVLLLAAGLLLRSFLALVQVDLGYRTEDTLIARVSLPSTDYPEREQRTAFSRQIREQLEALPGVVSVSHTSSPPLLGFDGDSDFRIEGRPMAEGEQPPVAWIRSVDADFFRNFGVQLLSGRGFSAADRDGAQDVVVLNQAAVDRYFDGQNPIGERISFGGDRWREVVGTVADTRHFALTAPARPAAYLHYEQSPLTTLFLLLRSEGDPYQHTAAMREVLAGLDTNLAFSQVQALDEVLSDATSSERLLAWLLGAFSTLSLLIAAVGLYGVMSYSVAQRRRELGIRMAIGAENRSLLALILRQGLGLVLVGTALGLLGALATGRLLAGVLYAVQPHDPLTFALVPMILIGVATMAILVPARRATRGNLLDVLRSE